MASRRIEIFFYGLFMDADLLRAKGVNPTNIRPASVPGFVLRIGQRATLLPNPNGLAHGILMQLTPAEIEQLYSEPACALIAQRPCCVRLAPVHVFLLYASISPSRRALMRPIRSTRRSCVTLRYGWVYPPTMWLAFTEPGFHRWYSIRS
jgi:hypothetical protein